MYYRHVVHHFTIVTQAASVGNSVRSPVFLTIVSGRQELV